MKKSLLTILFAVLAMAAFGQISASDPALRIWLKSETLSGTNVPVWFDSSTNGIVLAPPPMLPGDTQADPDHHTPLLVSVTNNGVIFNAVKFRQANDPFNAVDHFADRLWQTNKLDALNPTHVDPSQDITMITVYRNNAPSATLGTHQAVFGKRGPSCPYLFGFKGDTREHEFLTYAGSVVYPSGLVIPQTPEWAIVIMNITAGGTMTTTEYYASLGGWLTSTTSVARGGGDPAQPFTIAFHVQGAGATDDNPFGNGITERAAADFAEIAVLSRSLTGLELSALQTSLITKYFTLPGAPSAATQPQSQSVGQFNPVTFNILMDGTPPFTYQWYKGATAISGANGSSYSIPSVNLGDQAFYSVAITNVAGFTNSQAAFLTVIPDTNAPTIVSALLNVATNTQVTVTFSELVDPSSATNTANYNLSGGGSVSSIVAVPQTSNLTYSNYVFQVVLTTSPITSQKTLTATGVQDRAGNASAAQATIYVPVVVVAPPAENRLLWLAADTNVLADNIGVYEWQDMSGAVNNHNAGPGNGNTQAGLAAFPNGIHPVVSFDGSANLVLNNQPDFNLQHFSVYLVAAVDTSSPARRWLGDWEGFVIGSSDGNGAQAQFSHLDQSKAYRPLSTGPVLQSMVPAYIVGTFTTNTQTKTLSVNGNLPVTQTSTGTIDYSTARGLALGSLYDDGLAQALVGNIAEVLIYSDVSAAQDAAVRQYLTTKYFSPGGAGPTLVSAYNNATNKVRVQFSETLDSASATTATNYSINGGVTVSSATLINSTLVELSTTALTPNQVYTLTVNNVKNWGANEVAPNSQIQLTALNIGPISGALMHIADLSTNNVLAIEAENFTTNASPSGAGQSWVFNWVPTYLNPTDANITGSGSGVMEALPNNGVNTGAALTGPRLDYNAYFPVAGTYYSWLRGIGPSTSDDSAFIGLDGAVCRGISGFAFAPAGYGWGTTTASAFTSQVVVTTPGFHVINIWMREDGFALDKLVLSTNPSYNPTGVGPAESALVYEPLQVSTSGGNVVLTWGGPAILTSSTSVTGPFTDVVGATSPYNQAPTGSGKFYRLR